MTVTHLLTQFIPTNYNLSLRLDDAALNFSGTVTIKGEMPKSASAIMLHAKDLNFHAVTIDGHEATWHHGDDDEVTLTYDGLTPGDHIVVIDYSGTITDAMHGLYPCYFTVDGQPKKLLATQFESHHAREAFPCVDEPAAKATFDVTLTTATDIDVLSNMPISDQRTENDQLVTRFATTPKMSTYLLAWVTGELQKKTATTASGVDVSVYATHAQPAASLDFALDHSVKSIEFFEEYFGVDYPLPKSDQVALPDFSSGAMENWGLVTYRETALLADPTTITIDGKKRIATVISHELSHQWFGNLVTMKWWNNLWLNESFATLMEYIAVDGIWPDWNIWQEFASYESVIALRRDAIDGVQSVQVEVSHPDEISSLFDPSIVYAKGARLMRMLQDFIGHDAFRTGLESYFKEFAYSNTEADDLWRHLSKASGEDITAMMTTWISTSGYPVVHVTDSGLTQEQFFIGPHSPSDKLWPIPLGATQDSLPKLLSEKSYDGTVIADTRFNHKGSSHFITNYSSDHLKTLLSTISDRDEIERMQLLHEQTLLARGGVIASDQLIDLLDAYRHEPSASVWDIMALGLGELKKFVEHDNVAETALKQLAGELARPLFDELGWDAKAEEPANSTRLRSTILSFMLYSEDEAVLAEAATRFDGGIDTIDPEIRPLIISSVVKRSNDATIIEQLLTLYRETPLAHLRDDLCAGLTSVKQPAHIQRVLDQFTDKQTIRPQDIYHWFAYMVRNRYAHDLTWQWMVAHWQWIVDTFGGDKSYDDFPRYAASGITSREQFANYTDFFAPKKTIPALTRTIELGVTEIEGRLELLERDTDRVVTKLLARS